MSKLYSIWIDSEPAPVLSAYDNDADAMAAFRSLVLSVREDISSGVIEPGTDLRMSLYMHAYMLEHGCVRGLIRPVLVMAASEVRPETDGDCEVVDEKSTSEL